MGHDRIGFKTRGVRFIETLKNKYDIDAMAGHSQVTQ